MTKQSDGDDFRRDATRMYVAVCVCLAAGAVGCAWIGWRLGGFVGLAIGALLGVVVGGVLALGATLLWAMSQDGS